FSVEVPRRFVYINIHGYKPGLDDGRSDCREGGGGDYDFIAALDAPGCYERSKCKKVCRRTGVACNRIFCADIFCGHLFKQKHFRSLRNADVEERVERVQNFFFVEHWPAVVHPPWFRV